LEKASNLWAHKSAYESEIQGKKCDSND